MGHRDSGATVKWHAYAPWLHGRTGYGPYQHRHLRLFVAWDFELGDRAASALVHTSGFDHKRGEWT